MVRPRLVQEGTPIYGEGSEAASTTIVDDVMASPNRSTPTPKKNLLKVSSLQQAAQASKQKPRKKSSTSFTVGSEVMEASRSRSWKANEASSSSMNFQIGDSSASSTMPGNHTITSQHGKHSAMPVFQSHPRATQTQTHNTTIGVPMEHETMMIDEAHHTHHFNVHEHQHHHQHVNHYQVQQHGHQQQYFHNQQAANRHEIGNYSHIPQGPAAGGPYSNPRRSTTPAASTSYEIGGAQVSAPSEPPQKMEGVEDLSTKEPLVVLDGANVAYAYANAMHSASSLHQASSKVEPDAVGIQVATDYFQKAGLRVLIVLPQYWFRSKPRQGDGNGSNALMETPHLEVLQHLKAQGLIVASPPADDDDAYALTISRREESRSLRRNGEGPGFVLSNDMFRDAQQRDESLKQWLIKGRNDVVGPGRISYAFCDMGTMNDHGEQILDFVPNPRHPLVIWTESVHHQSAISN